MKRNAKTIIAAILFAAAAMSASSCSTSQTYPLTIDGEQIRAGIYIFEQQAAINAAKDKIAEEQPDLDTSGADFDFTKQTVEGKSFTDWVNEKAVEYCVDYIAEKRLFAENGLSLTAEQNKSVKDNVNALWDEENYYAQVLYGTSSVGEYFEKLGVGRQSFRDLQEASEMREVLFDHFYGEGGSLAATADEINAKLESDYAAVAYFSYDLENGDGAQAYYDRIVNGGDSFAAAYADHANRYLREKYDKQVAEAAQAAADGVETETETGESDLPSEPTTIDVPEEKEIISILKKDATDPAEEVVKQALEMAVGEVRVVTTGEGDSAKSYLVKRYNVLDYPDLTSGQISTIRKSLKEDDFNELLNNTGSAYKVTEDGSKNLYKLEKILNFKK